MQRELFVKSQSYIKLLTFVLNSSNRPRAIGAIGSARLPGVHLRAFAPATLERIATLPNARIFLSAGEASGDFYGAQIIAELGRRNPAATFTGLGGTGMAAAGQERVVRAEDVAHMGITEVVLHMPYIFAEYRRLVMHLKETKPSIAILIDFPDVNFRLAKHCRRLGIAVLWFVSPQLWAWKRRRLRWVQQRVDRMLVIFPFERPFYRARGVDAEFVGHPLATEPPTPDSSKQITGQSRTPSVSRAAFAERYWPEHPDAGIRLARPWVALLPGSRWKEVVANLPLMLEAAASLGAGYDFLVPVASTLKIDEVSKFIFGRVLPRMAWPKSSITLVPDAREALRHSRAAIVASGTATVLALTVGTPFIVVYRVSALTFWLAKRLIRYPDEIPAPRDASGNLPIAMVNLIAGRRIVPEFVNRDFSAENLAVALRPLLEDTPIRTQMIADLAEARGRLLPAGKADPIARVCDAIEILLGQAASL